jgi:hypothetical protein
VKKRLQIKTTLFSWMSAMTAASNLAPSKASFCRFDIRRASPTRYRFRSITIVFCYALHGSYGNPELDGVGSQNPQTSDR